MSVFVNWANPTRVSTTPPNKRFVQKTNCSFLQYSLVPSLDAKRKYYAFMDIETAGIIYEYDKCSIEKIPKIREITFHICSRRDFEQKTFNSINFQKFEIKSLSQIKYILLLQEILDLYEESVELFAHNGFSHDFKILTTWAYYFQMPDIITKFSFTDTLSLVQNSSTLKSNNKKNYMLFAMNVDHYMEYSALLDSTHTSNSDAFMMAIWVHYLKLYFNFQLRLKGTDYFKVIRRSKQIIKYRKYKPNTTKQFLSQNILKVKFI